MSATPKQCHYFTLWIKRSSCIKTHDVITARKSDQNISSIRLVNTEQRLQRPQLSQKHNVRIKGGARNDHRCSDTSWKTTTPLTHSYSNDGVIQLGPLGFDTMFEVIEISDACFVRLLLQYASHAVVNGSYISGEMNSCVSLSRNSTVARALWWRQTYVIIT